MTRPSEITIAWAAGLFDGEGTIAFYKARVHVAIHMTDKDLLDRMQEAFGGQIYLTTKQKEHHKTSWKWAITTTAKSIEFLDMIYPYLGVRRQAKVEAARDLQQFNKQAVSERVRQEILSYRDSGLTQSAIAAKVGCSREHVNKTFRKYT